MSFAAAPWLHLLWLLLPLSALLLWSHRRGHRDLNRLMGAGLLERELGRGLPLRRALQSLLLMLGLSLCAFALARPQLGETWRESQAEHAEIVVALDLSRSMDAQDVAPSRLARAQQDAWEFVQAMPGDRIGLVIFAAGAYPRAPLTTDHSVLEHMLQTARTTQMRAQGSSLGAALEQSVDLLSEEGAGAQAIVILSDGEDHRSQALDQAMDRVQARHIPVFVVGVGTQDGAPIPLPEGGFKRGPDGKVVVSRLGQPTLQAIAQATGGSYIESVPGGQDSRALASAVGTSLTRQLGQVERERIPNEVFQGPLAAGILLLLLSTGLRDRPAPWAHRLPWPALLVLLIPLAAAAEDMRGLLERGQYGAALQQAEQALQDDPRDVDALWARAEALYGLQQYEAAAQTYGLIADGARQRSARTAALHNQSIAAYQAGKLEDALSAQQRILLEDPQDPGAQQAVEQLTQELSMRRAPEPQEPPEQDPQEQDHPDQGEQQPEGGEQGEPQQGEGQEEQQPQAGEGMGQGDSGDPGASPERSGQDPTQQPPEGGDPDEPDTGLSEQAGGRSGEGTPTPDDGLQEARPEAGEGEGTQDSGDPSQSGEAQSGEAQPAEDQSGEPDDAPVGPGGMRPSQAREILDSVEEGSPRAAYGGKGGGRDW
ncbi:MAG: VWA domain-containing protein [Myxococcota bacterium]|nr:VWA domain-containing protein [Myxococcota bacterium]